MPRDEIKINVRLNFSNKNFWRVEQSRGWTEVIPENWVHREVKNLLRLEAKKALREEKKVAKYGWS
jgi:hypothetical protein